MTTPGGDFGVQGDDTVAARISVDVPDEALSQLSQLAKQAADLRTNMQATAKASADYGEYLRQLPELLRTVNDANEQFLGAAARTMETGVNAPAGQGRHDAQSTSTLWAAGSGQSEADSRLAQLREQNPRQYANLAAQQAIDQAGVRSVEERVVYEGGESSEERAAAVLAPAAPRRRPRQDGDGNRRPPNRGSGSPGGGSGGGSGPANRNTPGRGGGEGPRGGGGDDFDWLEYAQRFQRSTTGFLGTVYRETAQGGRSGLLDIAQLGVGGVTGVTQRFQSQAEQRAAQAQAEADEMARRAADPNDSVGAADAAAAAAAAARLRDRATSLGGAAKFGVRAAGVAGLAVGAGMAVQQGGQWYQQHAAMGMQRGGGFSEGIAFEAQVRTMAMNPFISLEQSRKIMQTALSEGYTGKEFDTVTQFMAENLQKMNVDVATSVRALREQVEKGGQSLQSVQTDIMTAQQLSADPDARRTAGQFVESYQRGTELGVGQGIGGQDSGQYGITTAGSFSDNPVLAPVASEQLQNSAYNNPITQAYIADKMGIEGPLSGVMAEALSREGGADEVYRLQLEQWAEYAQPYVQQLANATTEGQRREAVLGFQATLRGLDVNLDEAQARAALDEIMGEGGVGAEADRNREARTEAATGGPVEDPGEGYRAKQGLGVWGEIAQGSFGGLLKGAGSLLGIDSLEAKGTEIADHSREQMAEKWALQQAEGLNPRIRALIDREGYAGDIKVKSAEGEEMTLLDATRNKNVVDQLVSGSAQIQVPGGEFGTLENLSAQEAGLGAGGREQTTLVDLTDRAAEYLRITNPTGDPRNQNQRSADSGEDGASRNDPPAGQPPG